MPHPRLSRCVLASFAASGLVLSGCAESPGGSQSEVVRDSSGVVIVENPEDVWTGPEVWRLSSDPVLRIGSVEGEGPDLFGHVADLALLGDGRLVVAEGHDRTLRWFDEEGAFLFQRGGLGQGPGEIGSFGGVTVGSGDTLVVRDGAGGRITLFAPDGTPVESAVPVPLAASWSGTVHRLRDGSFVAVQVGPGPDRTAPRLEEGLVRIPTAVVRAGGDDGRVDTLGIFPGPEREVHRRDGIPSIEAPYFARGLSLAATGDRVFVGTQDPFEITVLAPGGKRLRSIRAPNVDIRLGPERIGEFRDWMLSRLDAAPPERRATLAWDFEATLAEKALPDNAPAYSTFITDPHGNLWVAEYRFELDLQPPERWVVFGPEGRFLTTVSLPPRFTLLAVGQDRVYGRWTGEMGVQYVVAYGIERS